MASRAEARDSFLAFHASWAFQNSAAGRGPVWASPGQASALQSGKVLCKVALSRGGSSDAPQVRFKAARRNSAVRAARASSDLRGHLLDTGDADDVHGTEHDGFIAFGKCHQHRVLDDGRILRVIDEKNIPTAATNLERLKRRLPKIHSNLLKHGHTIFLSETKASTALTASASPSTLRRLSGIRRCGRAQVRALQFGKLLCKVTLSRSGCRD